MNGLQIVYIIGALALGFLIGMITELFTENEIYTQLREENRELKRELEQAKKRPEVIEIVDKWSVTSPEEVSFPNTEGF